MNADKEYRELGPDEVIQAGDEYHANAHSWMLAVESVGTKVLDTEKGYFRRPITPAQGGDGKETFGQPQPSGVDTCVTQNCGTPLESEPHLGGKGENPDKTSNPGVSSPTTNSEQIGGELVGVKPSDANPATGVVPDASNPAQTLERMVEALESELADLRGENERLRARVEELEETLREALKLCRCNGTGKIRTHCSLCGDSTFDHICDDEEIVCTRCAKARAALERKAHIAPSTESAHNPNKEKTE